MLLVPAISSFIWWVSDGERDTTVNNLRQEAGI